jgi:uncharacterized protein YodC (DUF2158 family)
MRAGEMVRHNGGGPAMRVMDVFNAMVRCILIDSHGRIRQRFHYDHELTPLWLSLQPRSLWPDPGQLDAVEIEKEERAAAESRKAGRKAGRKQRRSNKAKRRSDAAA